MGAAARHTTVAMNVTYFYRPKGAFHSIERVFGEIRAAMPSEIRQREFHCRYTDHRTPLTFVRNIRDARRAVGEVNHITGGMHYLAFGLPRTRTLVTVHDIGEDYGRGGAFAWLKRKILFDWSIPVPARVVAISDFTRRQLIEHVGVDPKKIDVIPNPAPRGFDFSPKPFDSDKPRILCFGHLPNKNLARHAAALCGLRCHLRVIGRISPEDAEALRRAGVEYSNAYELSGAQIVEEYKACDLLLFASTYEGFGVPVLEAQLTGRPVVTSHAASLADVARDSAQIVDALDVASIRAGVQAVVASESLRAELVGRGLKNAGRFSPAAVAGAYCAIYKTLAR